MVSQPRRHLLDTKGTEMTTLYRVTLKTTASVQPLDTYWTREVLYCGYDRDEAR